MNKQDAESERYTGNNGRRSRQNTKCSRCQGLDIGKQKNLPVAEKATGE